MFWIYRRYSSNSPTSGLSILMMVACLCTSVYRHVLLVVEAENKSLWLQRMKESNSCFLFLCFPQVPSSRPHLTSSTPDCPILPVHTSSIAWLFIIISVMFTPDFIISCLMLFVLLRVQGFLLSLGAFVSSKLCPFSLVIIMQKNNWKTFSLIDFPPKVWFRRKLELNCSFVGPELRSVARGSTPTTHLGWEERRLHNLLDMVSVNFWLLKTRQNHPLRMKMSCFETISGKMF